MPGGLRIRLMSHQHPARKLMTNFKRLFSEMLIVALVVTAALGPYFLPLSVAGFNLFGFRQLLPISLVLLPFLSPDFSWRSSWLTRIYFLLGVVWLAWGGIGLFWTPSFLEGVKELVSIGMGFLLAFLFLSLKAYSSQGIKALAWGWTAAFFATFLVAGWELMTREHLPSYFFLTTPSAAKSLIASTFGNPNGYGGFLVLSYAFLWMTFWSSRRFWVRLIPASFLLITPFLLLQTSSRLAILGNLAQMTLYGLLCLRRLRENWIPLLFVSLSIIIFFMGFSNPKLKIHREMSYLTKEIKIRPTDAPSRTDPQPGESRSKQVAPRARPEAAKPNVRRVTSSQIRMNLIVNGLWLVKRSWGLGVGPGAFEYYHEQGLVPRSTVRAKNESPIINPHNLGIEIISQYGLVVFILFAVWYASLFYIAFEKRGDQTAIFLLLALVGYAPVTAASSSYIDQQINWTFFASILMLGVHLLSKDGHRRDMPGHE